METATFSRQILYSLPVLNNSFPAALNPFMPVVTIQIPLAPFFFPRLDKVTTVISFPLDSACLALSRLNLLSLKALPERSSERPSLDKT